MAIFGGKGERGANGAPAPRGGQEGSMSIIGPGMHIVGDLVTDGTVRVEGRIDGTVRAGKAVVIGKDGEVRGDIITHAAVIGGRVRGTVTAEGSLELQATCDIEGQVQAAAQHLRLEEGARFNGQVHMLNGDAPPRAALPPGAVAEPPVEDS
ncbi:MAG TPA: polymer-forming cytoskeletal protein [Longimicrobiaceae bacterium]|nr:polymer-forming cytoskeletal protein [Longimicrobiaceae bacterium]